MTTDINEIIAENQRRNQALPTAYDPMRGVGCCGERVQVGDLRLPAALAAARPDYTRLTPLEQDRVRIGYDFEFWCVRCVKIRDKLTGRVIPLVLNRPQRRLLAVMEGQRLAHRPIRVILLKARQWGGSTLVQIYMAWFQMVLHHGWNSIICGHVKMAGRSIKRMYNLLLREYPGEMRDDDGGKQLRFTALDGDSSVQQLAERDALVLTGTALSEDAPRGYDLAMAHLSEVAFWKSSALHRPDDVVRSVCGSVALKPDTVVVMESTANGVGNFFHREWLRAVAGHSDKEAVFVPWHEIEIYRRPVADARRLWDSMDGYERALWRQGLTLEQIAWYHDKRREYGSHELMQAEYPGNDIEAFTTTGSRVFSSAGLQRLRADCRPPVAQGDVTGDHKSLTHVRIVPAGHGPLQVWTLPDREAGTGRYVVSVDVGGRSDKADWSVIAVWDRAGDRPEIVAQWRGHIDHDLLAWKAAQIAALYGQALLVIESNTLETERTVGENGEFILGEIRCHYRNLYYRSPGIPGFQTNVKTKRQIIGELISAVRDHGYVERDSQAVDEMSAFELKPNGSTGAVPGRHDDIVMTRAIGYYVIKNKLPDLRHRVDKAGLL